MPFNMETITLHHSQDDPAAAAAAAAAEKEINVSWKDVKYQILSSNVAFLFTIHAGVNLAFSNFLLNDLDKDASSWFASLGAAGTPIGAISCGPLMDAVGRKGCNLVIALPCVAAWLILSVVDQRWSAISLWLLYLSRFLGGIAAGLTTANLVYVSETSHKKYRATFLSLVGLYFSFGILLTTLLKLVFTWKQSAVFFAVFFSIVALLVSRLTPESPVWLANFRHDPRAARKSLLALNSNSQIFEREWRDLMANAFSSSPPPATKRQNSGGGRSWFEPAVYKPTATLLALILAQQLSGLYATVYYAYDIFTRLAPQKGSAVAREAFVLFGVVRFAASLVSCCVSAKVGRRKLLIASAAGMLLALVGVIVALLSSSSSSSSAAAEYAAISCFVLYVGVGAVGVMTVPWTLIVELLPTEKRASAGAALVSYAYLLIFALVKTLPFALDRVDVTLAFAFFAIVSSLIVVFVYFFIPETLNRTLLEIESFYSGLVPVNAAGANFDECADDATKTTAITGDCDANETVCPAAEASYRSLLGANP